MHKVNAEAEGKERMMRMSRGYDDEMEVREVEGVGVLKRRERLVVKWRWWWWGGVI